MLSPFGANITGRKEGNRRNNNWQYSEDDHSTLEKLQSASVDSAITLASITATRAQYPAYFRYSKPSFTRPGIARP